MKLQEKLIQLHNQKKAILAANFYNLETLQGIIRAAKSENSGIILQASESSLKYMNLEMAAKMAFQAISDYGVEAWLHLDHGGNVDLVQKCLDAGFNSVMIDASEESFDENIKTTLEVVKRAQRYGANVEAELGYVAKLNQSQGFKGFTQPEEAKRFVEATGVNALAIAIGTAHGFYKEEPKLEIELLSRINQLIDIPLVLHGGSGVPDKSLQLAILNGITKINLATETKNIFMKKLKQELSYSEEIDLRIVFPKATDAVTELIRKKIQTINT
ncbi:MAG TPA: class II fructose-bisphosphate aldolase [Bacteroidales bacterium]|nr:class II fructose-bisphosphate aldolase [Bacteroidales bacterium]